MSDFKIEKNVPLPNLGHARIKYPLEDMEIGDSFTFPLVMRPSISGSIKHLKERQDMYFTTRTVDKGIGRVWRIEKPDDSVPKPQENK